MPFETVSKPPVPKILLLIADLDMAGEHCLLDQRFELKQKRRGARAPRREKQQKRLLIVGQQAREQEPLIIKSTHTDAQENVLRSFVTHSGEIITFPAQIANNLIKYRPHAERFIFPVKPSASPSGVFVCINILSLRAAE